jgi:hypothetical protein
VGRCWNKCRRISVLVMGGLVFVSFHLTVLHAALTTNNWIASDGKWETTGDWSLGLPSVTQSAVIITNGNSSPVTTKTVTIDQTTVSSAPGSLTISNLFIAGHGTAIVNGIQNSLLLSNMVSTPLQVLNSITMSNRSSIYVTNAILSVGGSINDNTFLSLDAGTLQASAATFTLDGPGQGMIQSGTWINHVLVVGDTAGSHATFTMNGGTVTLLSAVTPFAVANSVNSTGTVVISGGFLNSTNGFADIGVSGAGQLTLSNATWLSGIMFVGDTIAAQGTLTVADGGNLIAAAVLPGDNGIGTVWLTGGNIDTGDEDVELGSDGVGVMTVSNGTWESADGLVGVSAQGTLTFAGGVTTLLDGLEIALNPGSTGTVWMNGGQLVSGFGVDVGDSGAGQMTVSNGLWQGRFIEVGATSGGSGALTVAGGTNSAYTKLIIGSSNCSSTGTVIMTGGILSVTNAAHNAVLDLESGSFLLQGGTLVVDQLAKTNSCGTFQQTGGILVVGGITNIPPPFRVTSITPVGNNIRITWTTAGGSTNQVQVANGTGNGSYATNGFTNLGTQMFIVGSGAVTTNYVDVGGATNKPSRYYRVRLVP